MNTIAALTYTVQRKLRPLNHVSLFFLRLVARREYINRKETDWALVEFVKRELKRIRTGRRKIKGAIRGGVGCINLTGSASDYSLSTKMTQRELNSR
jgi:hypothetical protein